MYACYQVLPITKFTFLKDLISQLYFYFLFILVVQSPHSHCHFRREKQS